MSRWPVFVRGTCGACGEKHQVRADGLMRMHRWWPALQNCAGSGRLPTEGLLMPCVWCSGPFLSDDDDHRFCSERCVKQWEEGDGSFEGWDLDWWFDERHVRSMLPAHGIVTTGVERPTATGEARNDPGENER